MNETYYEFSQNNSGGQWDETLPKCLYVKADNEKKALLKAFKLGVYFDGVSLGIDCDCCGDRWTTPDKMAFPYTYNSFPKKEAEEIAKKYKGTVTKKKNHWGNYGVIFDDLKSYLAYSTRDGKKYMGIDYYKIIK